MPTLVPVSAAICNEADRDRGVEFQALQLGDHRTMTSMSVPPADDGHTK